MQNFGETLYPCFSNIFDAILKPYKEITPIDVDDFLNPIVNTMEIKNKAFYNMCGILKQTFEYAVSARYISQSENPYRVEINKKTLFLTERNLANGKFILNTKSNCLLAKCNADCKTIQKTHVCLL